MPSKLLSLLLALCASFPAMADEPSPRSSTLTLAGTPEEQAQRALRMYDMLLRGELFPRGYNLSEPGPVLQPRAEISAGNSRKFKFNASQDQSLMPSQYYLVYDGDKRVNDPARELAIRTQSTADRIADMIHPGLGRFEFKIGSNRARLDYLNARRCRMRGVGICFQVGFH